MVGKQKRIPKAQKGGNRKRKKETKQKIRQEKWREKDDKKVKAKQMS